nr:hypothetical protein Iba_chr05dCG11390 [Ipomoea batatas]
MPPELLEIVLPKTQQYTPFVCPHCGAERWYLNHLVIIHIIFKTVLQTIRACPSSCTDTEIMVDIHKYPMSASEMVKPESCTEKPNKEPLNKLMNWDSSLYGCRILPNSQRRIWPYQCQRK